MNQNRNIIIYFIGKLFPAITQLLIIVLGIRLIGASEYGKFNLVYNTALIIASLSVGWIQQGILRYFHSFKKSIELVRGDFLQIGLYSSLLASVIALLSGIYYFHLQTLPLLTYIAFAMLFGLFLIELTLLQVQFKATQYSFIESSYNVFSIILGVLFILYTAGRDFTTFFLPIFLSLLLVVFLLAAWIIKNRQVSFIPLNKSFIIQIFSYGVPLTLWLLISNVFNIADRYVIKYYLDYDAVGKYSAVYDLIYKVSGFLTLPILLAFHPSIAKYWNENKKHEADQLMKITIIKELSLSIIIFGFLYIFKDFVFSKILKLEIHNFTVIFLPLAISSILWQLSMIIQKPLEFNQLQLKMILGILIAITLNVMLNFMLIPKYGIYVCGFTTLIATLFYTVYVYLYSRNELKPQELNNEG